MSNFQDQFSAATKANLDAQLAIFSTLTNKAFESIEKVVELNLAVAKTSFDEISTAVKEAKGPQEFFNFTATQTQPNAEKALSYARQLGAIISGVQAEVTKTTEAHVADTNRKVIALVEEISRNAPAGSENAVALLKSAIGNASASYEQISKSIKQAVEVLEGNLNSAAGHISQVTNPTRRGKK